MADLLTASKLCKEEREKRGLTREDLHKITKIPIDIIRRLEEDEKYLKNDPYAYFLMKVLIEYYQLDVKLTKVAEETTGEQINRKNNEKNKEEKQSFLIKFFKTVFLFIIGFIFTFLSISSKNRQEQEDKLAKFFTLLYAGFPEEKSIQIVSENKNKTNKISLKAIDYVWLTAYIDGKEKILKLKKGQKIKLSFKNKIEFETIGNADNLIIVYENKQVAFEKKVVHNLFVDSDGVFFNGYNLAKEEG